MSYEVIARKWRPRQFAEIVGQDHVVRTLVNSIRQNRLAHAYLFVGPRGTGKTSTARVFAKALNCAEGPTETPCDRCDSCLEIGRGASMDVLEIDGASNNGVEQVRELRANVQYAPTRGRYKIYIIDEVHMLTQQAFNALLKTLEEPPPHVKFFFATTEPQKIPATIISRCQRFDLRRIPRREIVERLERIAKDEGVEIDAAALEGIARGSDGALRDAESALDQLISFCDGRITEEDVAGVFGLAGSREIAALGDAVLRGDSKAVLTGVREISEAGKDLFRLLIDLMEYFRGLLICTVSDDPAALLDFSEEAVADLARRASGVETGTLLTILEILSESESSLRWAVSKRIALELALIRALRAARGVSIETVLERLAAMRESLEGGSGSPDPGSGAGRAGEPAGLREPPGLFTNAPESGGGSNGTIRSAREAARSVADGSEAPSSDAGEIWERLLAHFARNDAAVHNYLKAGSPAGWNGTRFVVGFGPGARLHRDMLERSATKESVESALARITGRTVQFSAVDALPRRAGEEEAETPPAAVETPRSLRERAMRDPLVRRLIEFFDGRLLDVRI